MVRLNIKQLNTQEKNFKSELDALLSVEEQRDFEVQEKVQKIIAQVRSQGDQALLELTRKFDHSSVQSITELEISKVQRSRALGSLSYVDRTALEAAAERIRDYHQRQKQTSWQYRDKEGTLLGQQITAMDRVGVYVPGGKAAYPSSVLMNSIPAKVAGVEEIIMVVPAPNGVVNPLVLAAAAIVDIDRIFTIGGAQAIAALAYGTETVPAVDKIVGPGNIFVANAKKAVFGKVGIDMVAGPSEILIVSDGNVSPDWIAMDLFSQAEHDEEAQSILMSPNLDFLAEVQQSIQRLLPTQQRASIISESLSARGAFIQCKNLREAMHWANYIAPEHLELAIESAESWLPEVKHAGAVFLGNYTPEAFGDYCAGPNHVLPTSGTARFASPLGVYDFQKRTSLIGCTPESAQHLSKVAALLATGEGLQAHSESAAYRGQPSVAVHSNAAPIKES